MKRADLEHDQIERAEAFADRSIFRRQPAVSPPKNTAWRGVRIAIDDHSVVLRSFMPRPEKCCDGAAVTVRSAFGRSMRFPPVEFDDALRHARPTLRGARRRRAT